MNDQPISRKRTHYPKDFMPSSSRVAQGKRFTFNEEYQIEAQSIKKYERSMDGDRNLCGQCSRVVSTVANPEKSIVFGVQAEEEGPLGRHLGGGRRDLDQDLLKKPRFCVNQKHQIEEREEAELESSMSPGHIRRQLAGRQAPLPAEDPCKIQLIKTASGNSKKVNGSYIKYRSTGDFDSKRWLSSEKDVIEKFKGSRSKVEELPLVGRKCHQKEQSFAAAKEQYDSFRRRQESAGSGFGKVNNLLTSMRKKDERANLTELPSFDKTALQKLKDDINNVVRKKKGFEKHSESESSESQQEQQMKRSQMQRKNKEDRRKVQFARAQEDNRPELQVSYRSSLSFLKDLFNKSVNLSAYHLVVKIPKLFTEQLVFKGQERDDLYQTSRGIFEDLKIPHENLVIKKYTNCTMLIARNVCMIWHFDGRRYLGGWQSEYLDEGFKHGLGLQWEPKKYVYYGQFVRNKKHGLGIYKDKHAVNYIGYWSKGQRCDKGELISQKIDENNALWHEQESSQESSGQQNVYQYL